jgi:hypothetical protein
MDFDQGGARERQMAASLPTYLYSRGKLGIGFDNFVMGLSFHLGLRTKFLMLSM